MSWKIIIIAFTTQFGFNSDLQILLIVATLVNDNYIRIQFEMHLVLLKVDNCDVYRRPARTVRMVIDSFRSARSCNGLQSAVILKMELCSATYQHLRNRTNLPSIHHNSITSRSAISLCNVRFIQCAEIWYMIYRLLENRIWTEGIFPAIFAKWYIGNAKMTRSDDRKYERITYKGCRDRVTGRRDFRRLLDTIAKVMSPFRGVV